MAETLEVIIQGKDGASRIFKEVSTSATEAGTAVNKAGETGAKGTSKLSTSVSDLNSNLNETALAAATVGGIITTALAAPMIAGATAAWNQVSAVEQATLALRAYETDAGAVNDVLQDLLEYAQSDMGVLFNRTELFASAQALKLYGAETENLAEYVEILSRSVGLGLSDWDQLNTVIGRVGSTGKLTGQDFDYLVAAGFRLDESMRNANVSWDELFTALDAGIPADALAGQATTIEGMLIRMGSAVRNLGGAFLGVDAETSKFIEGGLGDRMSDGLQTVTGLLIAMQPAAEFAGNALGTLVGVADDVAYAFSSLPEPLQTAIVGIAGISGGALLLVGSAGLLIPKIVGMVTALKGLPLAIRAITMAMGPVGWAITGIGIALTAGAALWGSYRKRVDENAEAIRGLEAAWADTDAFIESLPSSAANRVQQETDAVQRVLADFTTQADTYKVDISEILAFPDENQGQRLSDSINTMLDSNVGGAFLEWAEANKDELGEELYGAILNRENLDFYAQDIIAAYDEFLNDLVISPDKRAELERQQQDLWETIFSPNVDTDEALAAYSAIFDEFARTGDVDAFIADMEELDTALENGTYAANGFAVALGGVANAVAVGPVTEYREELEKVRQVTEGILEAIGKDSLLSRLNLAGVGNDATIAADGVMQASAALDTMYRVIVSNTDAIAEQTQGVADWITGLTEWVDATEEGGEKTQVLNDLLNEGRITQEQYNDAMEASNSILAANESIQRDVLAIQAQQAPMLAANTVAMADYVESIREMNDGTVEGQVRQLEALSWMDEGLQQQVLNVAELADQMKDLGPAGEESFRLMVDGIAATNPALFTMLETLGYVQNVVRDQDGRVISYDVSLDGAEGAMSDIDRLTMSIDALIVTLGGVPPEVEVEVTADTADAESGISRTQRSLTNLDGQSATVTIALIDGASFGISAAQAALNALDGRVATTYTQNIPLGVGPSRALGGVVEEYAGGGVVIRAGEVGPEILHYANGGTAILPTDGLYNVPVGGYITPNHALGNTSNGGITVDFSGAVFHNTSRDEMNAWAQEDFLPEIRRATTDLKIGMGVEG